MKLYIYIYLQHTQYCYILYIIYIFYIYTLSIHKKLAIQFCSRETSRSTFQRPGRAVGSCSENQRADVYGSVKGRSRDAAAQPERASVPPSLLCTFVPTALSARVMLPHAGEGGRSAQRGSDTNLF